jgi:saccharopine dehydrogenase-like NADP-dependent oxidoreductase
MVGSVMAADLAAGGGFEVTVADRSPAALERMRKHAGDRIRTVQVDLADRDAVVTLVRGADVVLGAAASAIGLQLLRSVIEAGAPYCDISFMPESALELDAEARRRGVTAIVDCGVAPGMSNLLAAASARRLDRAESVAIYVGGLPSERRLPFQYKAAFAPADVLEEYTRPARLVEHGQVVTRAALTEPEFLEFAGIGTLEAFNTDGLRSLLHTLDVPFMKEKTLRYPGHRALMEAFRDAGLFDKTLRSVGSATVRPLDVTSAILFPQWTYGEGEEDLTVMRVIVTGRRGGHAARLSWDLFDRRDPHTGATSMARTTAFPCTIVARLIASGRVRRPGVAAPEALAGDDAIVEHILAEHERRGVMYCLTEEEGSRAACA